MYSDILKMWKESIHDIKLVACRNGEPITDQYIEILSYDFDTERGLARMNIGLVVFEGPVIGILNTE